MKEGYISPFWEKVIKCEHKNLSPNYCERVPCCSDYCSSDETHCLDCGVYITECICGAHGLSGWPNKRWEKYWDKRYQKIKERMRERMKEKNG